MTLLLNLLFKVARQVLIFRW